MDPMIPDLNRVLKYGVDERAAFERAIDENPLESTNHTVYADWLDENGEPDEAAFRRSMGKWMTEHGARRELAATRKEVWDRWLLNNKWAIEPLDTPKGVYEHQLPRSSTELSPSDPSVATRSSPIQTDRRKRPYNWGHTWRTYRGMESAFRKSFMANRKSPPSSS